LSQSEPSDYALATIASVLDHGDPENTVAEEKPGTSGRVDAKILSQSEPSDYALATIASVLDHGDPENAVAEEKPGTSERVGAKISSQSEPSDYAMAVIASLPDHPGPHPEPTDLTLATIASILDHPGSHREPEKAPAEGKPEPLVRIDADGYSEVGPGPIEALRFKWTIRKSDDQYFVDETIGKSSQPISSGPMSADAAIKFVDDHAREARQRFETLRNEISGRAAAGTHG
jgi:hypothetical protein